MQKECERGKGRSGVRGRKNESEKKLIVPTRKQVRVGMRAWLFPRSGSTGSVRRRADRLTERQTLLGQDETTAVRASRAP